MKKFLLAMLVLTSFTLAGFVSQASAVSVDGLVGGGEWVLADLHTFANDPNEGGIPDEYDIEELRVLHVNTGGVGDGLYFRVDTFDAPTLVGGPDSVSEAFLQIYIDFDGDGTAELFTDFNNAQDPTDAKYGVYSSGSFSGASFIGYGSGDIDDVYELFLPEDFFDGDTAGPFTISTSTGFRVRLDNNGSPQDDFLPNSGFTTGIPEPSSIILIGSGLLGLAGIRRRFKA